MFDEDKALQFSRIELTPGVIEAKGAGWAVGFLVESFGSLFKEAGAENNLTLTLEHDEYGPFTVTMQRLTRPTPAQQREEAIHERDAAREAVRRLLLSADCTWEERGDGHDWQDACAFARAVLADGREKT